MKFIKDYLKERNIPLDSLEANSIMEGFLQGFYFATNFAHHNVDILLNDHQSINNVETIREFINTETPEPCSDKFYTIQIMQRSKEHPEFEKHKKEELIISFLMTLFNEKVKKCLTPLS